MREKDITQKYLTPYGYVNPAPEQTAATDPALGKQLWQRSKELSEQYVPGLEFPQTLL